MSNKEGMTAEQLASFLMDYMIQVDLWQPGKPSQFSGPKTVGRLTYFDMRVTKRRSYRVTVEREA